MRMLRKHIIRLSLLTTLLIILSTTPAWASTVEYNDLRVILSQNSSSLDSINDNLESIQDQINLFSAERTSIKNLKEKAEADGDTATAAIYELNSTQLNKQIVALKESYEKQTKSRSSLDKALNQLEKTAQSLMIVYNQTLLNQQAAEKNYDAAVAKYNTVLNKYTAGVSNEADVTNASNNMLMCENLLESANQQLKSARYSLIKTLGLQDDGTVTIGTVPDPDLSAINAIDYANDRIVYVGYSDEVKQARNIKTSKFYYDSAQTQASGDANAEYDAMCSQLQAEVLEYQAKSAAYEAAKKSYDTLQHKKQLGMVTDTDFKAGEATYYSALSQFKTEAMNLLKAYEDYKWTLYGL